MQRVRRENAGGRCPVLVLSDRQLCIRFYLGAVLQIPSGALVAQQLLHKHIYLIPASSMTSCSCRGHEEGGVLKVDSLQLQFQLYLEKVSGPI